MPGPFDPVSSPGPAPPAENPGPLAPPDLQLADARFGRLQRRAVLAPVLTLAIVATTLGAGLLLTLWSARWVRHSDEVLTLAARTERRHLDAVGAARAWISGADAAAHRRLQREAAALRSDFETLRESVHDNSVQTRRVDLAEAQTFRWLEAAETRGADVDAPDAVVRRHELAMVEERVRTQQAFAGFSDAEVVLRDERWAATGRATFALVGVAGIAMLAAAGLARRRVRADLVEAHGMFRDALARSLEARSDLERRVHERSSAAEAQERRLAAVAVTQLEVMAGNMPLSAVMRLVVERARTLSRASGAVLEMRNGELLEYREVAGALEGAAGVSVPMRGSASGLALRTATCIVVQDAPNDPRTDAAACRRLGIGSLVVAPIRSERDAVGVLKVTHEETRHFGDDAAHVLQLLAGLLSAAVTREEQRRATEEHRTELERTAAALTASHAELASNERRSRALAETLRATIDGMADGVLVVEPDGRVTEMNAAAVGLLGGRWARMPVQPGAPDYPFRLPDDSGPLPPQETSVARALAGEDVPGAETLVAVNGTRRWIGASVRPVRDAEGEVRTVVAVLHDVTDQRERMRRALAGAEAASREAVTDELTGLYNRRGFLARGGTVLQACDAERSEAVLVFVDLDGMKGINDMHGHAAGDEALRLVARTLREAFRVSDVLARLGGDEFVVLAPRLDGTGAERVVARVRDGLATRNSPLPYRVGVSVGCVVRAPGTDGLERLLERADAAMYAQKQERRPRALRLLPTES